MACIFNLVPPTESYCPDCLEPFMFTTKHAELSAAPIRFHMVIMALATS